jgi:hypothetical protein
MHTEIDSSFTHGAVMTWSTVVHTPKVKSGLLPTYAVPVEWTAGDPCEGWCSSLRKISEWRLLLASYPGLWRRRGTAQIELASCLSPAPTETNKLHDIIVTENVRSQAGTCFPVKTNEEKKKLRGFGPLANYAERATAACWRSDANFSG